MDFNREDELMNKRSKQICHMIAGGKDDGENEGCYVYRTKEN